MAFLDALLSAVHTLLKFILWTAAALLGLAFVSLALVLVLAWIGVARLLGRPSRVTLTGRVQDLRRFGAQFGSTGFRAGVFRSRRTPTPAEPAQDDPPAGRPRIGQPGPVEDVEARDLPADRPRS